MKYNFLIAICCALLISAFSSSDAQAAKIPIFYGTKEKIVKIHDLPKTNDYEIRGGRHFDLGYMYKSYELMWIPLHASEGKVVGFIDSNNYVRLSNSDIQWIVKENKIQNLDSIATIPFWDSWGGKLIVAIIVILIIVSFVRKGDSSVDEQSGDNPQ